MDMDHGQTNYWLTHDNLNVFHPSLKILCKTQAILNTYKVLTLTMF